MKKILASISIIAAVAAIAIGATTAYFSDNESSQNNTFSAGTLDLVLESSENIPFHFENLAPGWTQTLTYTLRNDGTIDGNLSLLTANTENTEGENPEPEEDITEPGDLGGNMNAMVTVPGYGTFSGTLADINLGQIGNVFLGAGEEITITIDLSVPTSVGNDIMGDIITGGFTARLDQALND